MEMRPLSMFAIEGAESTATKMWLVVVVVVV